jgi:glycosyltransferase involved in cell wall biosynthesis
MKVDKKKNILFISYDLKNGGAAQAAYKIIKLLEPTYNYKILTINGLYNNLNDFDLNVNIKLTNKIFNKINYILKLIFYNFLLSPKYNFTNNYISIFNSHIIKKFKPDLIFLFNISYNTLSICDLIKISKYNATLIWRFSDMWPITGGCHYSYGCNNYFDNECKNCVALKGFKFIAYFNYLLKKSIVYKNINVITPSEWLYDIVYKTKKFKSTYLINTPVNEKVFKNLEVSYIPDFYMDKDNNYYILFGGDNIENNFRKGYHTFKNLTMNNLFFNKKKIIYLVFGNSKPQSNTDNVIYLGKLSQHKLAIFYNLSDVYLNLSIEDNLPNTILESLSCGTKVLTSNVGGVNELIMNIPNGIFIISSFNITDIQQNIYFVLKHGSRKNDISFMFQKSYSENMIRCKYINFINSLD